MTVNKIKLALGIGMGLLAGVSIHRYCTADLSNFERDLLKGTAGYIQEYKDQNPSEPLNYAQQTLEIIAQNKNVPSKEISNLEKEIIKINKEIGNSQTPSVYQPVLKSVSGKIKDITNKHGRHYINLLATILCGLSSAIFFATTPSTWKKNKEFFS